MADSLTCGKIDCLIADRLIEADFPTH